MFFSTGLRFIDRYFWLLIMTDFALAFWDANENEMV